MSLIYVRQKFVERSGRYDLIVDDIGWQDNGADYFVNEGQQIIDRSVQIPMSIGRTYCLPNNGDHYVLVDNMRACERVFVHGDGMRTELEKKEFVDLANEISDPVSSLEIGRPTMFAIGHIRSENPADRTVHGEYLDYSAANDYRDVILIYPPSGDNYNIEVWGLWYENRLINDTDESTWTHDYPELSVWAALYAHEVSRRNTSGANDWWNALAAELNKLDDDYVYSEIVDQNRFRDV